MFLCFHVAVKYVFRPTPPRPPSRDVVDALPAHSGRCRQCFDWLPVGEGPGERFLSVLRDRQLYLQCVAIQGLKSLQMPHALRSFEKPKALISAWRTAAASFSMSNNV